MTHQASLLKRIQRQFKRWKYRDLTQWREDLTDYEKTLFISALKGRTQSLQEYFERVIQICTDHRENRTFGSALKRLADPQGVLARRGAAPTDEVIAARYFDAIKTMTAENYSDPIAELLPRFETIVDLKSLGQVLNELNQICGSVVQCKEKLFLYGLNIFHTAHEPDTGAMIAAEPKEMVIVLMPFKILLENIFGVAQSTSQTIHQWHKEQFEWKTNFLNILGQRLNQRNQLLVIFVAVALSASFFVSSDPYEKLLLERRNESLNAEITRLRTQTKDLSEDLKRLKSSDSPSQQSNALFSPARSEKK